MIYNKYLLIFFIIFIGILLILLIYFNNNKENNKIYNENKNKTIEKFELNEVLPLSNLPNNLISNGNFQNGKNSPNNINQNGYNKIIKT